MGKQKKEKLDVFKCPPTKPTLHFSLSHQNYVPRIALLQAPKKSHLHHWSFKRTIFFTELCGLFGFLCLGQSFSQRKQESENLLTPSPLLSFLGLSFPISFFLSRFVPSSLTPHPTPPTFFFLSFSPFPFSLRLFFPFGFSCFSLIS